MRILITGGAGFIGSHVAALMCQKQNEVMILDDLSTGRMEWVNELVVRKHSVGFDLCRVETWGHVDPVIKGFRPDVICHLAAQPAISTSWADPILNANVNEIGTLNLVLSAREHGVKRFIFTSTSAVYKETLASTKECSPKEPNSPYGISKLAAEFYVRSIFPNSVVLRLGNVYGPRQVPVGENQVIPRILRHFLYGDDFSIHGDGEQKRDFVFVEDVAEAFLMALWGKPGTFNVATGERVSVNELAKMIELMYGVPGYGWKHTKQQDPRRDIILDVSAAHKELGWKPRHSLQDGLQITCEWWNNRWNRNKQYD